MFQWHLEYWHRFLQANVKMPKYPFMFQFSEKYWHRFLQANDANFGTQVSVSNEILTQIATSKCEKFKFTFHFSMSLRILTLVSKLSSKLMKSQLPRFLWQLKYWHSILRANLKTIRSPSMFQCPKKYWHRFL